MCCMYVYISKCIFYVIYKYIFILFAICKNINICFIFKKINPWRKEPLRNYYKIISQECLHFNEADHLDCKYTGTYFL